MCFGGLLILILAEGPSSLGQDLVLVQKVVLVRGQTDIFSTSNCYLFCLSAVKITKLS